MWKEYVGYSQRNSVIKYFWCSNRYKSFAVFPTHRQNRQMLTYQKVIQNHATGEQGRENTYWNGDMGKISKVGST